MLYSTTKNTKLLTWAKTRSSSQTWEILQGVDGRKRHNHCQTLGPFWLVPQGLQGTDPKLNPWWSSLPDPCLQTPTCSKQMFQICSPRQGAAPPCGLGTPAPPSYCPLTPNALLPCSSMPSSCHFLGSLGDTAVLGRPPTLPLEGTAILTSAMVIYTLQFWSCHCSAWNLSMAPLCSQDKGQVLSMAPQTLQASRRPSPSQASSLATCPHSLVPTALALSTRSCHAPFSFSSGAVPTLAHSAQNHLLILQDSASKVLSSRKPYALPSRRSGPHLHLHFTTPLSWGMLISVACTFIICLTLTQV